MYTEERDRPVIVMVDQRLPMFFGSQRKMKSVVAAEVAAITAWRVLSVGDRFGAILFNDVETREIKPTRNERKVMGALGDLTQMNNQLKNTTLLKKAPTCNTVAKSEAPAAPIAQGLPSSPSKAATARAAKSPPIRPGS